MKQCYISRWMYFIALWIIIILIVMIHTTLRESYVETFGNPEYFQDTTSHSANSSGSGSGSLLTPFQESSKVGYQAPAQVYIQSEVDTNKFMEETDERLEELASRVAKVETQLTEASKGAAEASQPSSSSTMKQLPGPPGEVVSPNTNLAY